MKLKDAEKVPAAIESMSLHTNKSQMMINESMNESMNEIVNERNRERDSTVSEGVQ